MISKLININKGWKNQTEHMGSLAVIKGPFTPETACVLCISTCAFDMHDIAVQFF